MANAMADAPPKMKTQSRPGRPEKSARPEKLEFEDEYIGPAGENLNQAQDIPQKEEWKPSRARANKGDSFTPGFVKERVQEGYFTLSMLAMPFLPNTARALFEVSESSAQIAEDWAQADPKFREFILKMLKTSHGFRFAMANAPVFMAAFAEIKDYRGSGNAGRVREETGGASSAPGFPNPQPADPKSQTFQRQNKAAAPDAQGFTYKVPDNAVLS